MDSRALSAPVLPRLAQPQTLLAPYKPPALLRPLSRRYGRDGELLTLWLTCDRQLTASIERRGTARWLAPKDIRSAYNVQEGGTALAQR